MFTWKRFSFLAIPLFLLSWFGYHQSESTTSPEILSGKKRLQFLRNTFPQAPPVTAAALVTRGAAPAPIPYFYEGQVAANRAPLRRNRSSVIPSSPSCDGSNRSACHNNSVVINSSGIHCWDAAAGEGTWVPTWMDVLMHRMTPVYGELLGAINSDPEWTAIVGFVPSRFMDINERPTKRRGGSDMHKPPVGRGDDQAAYLDEYNASWHTSFLDRGLNWTFQLVHRNAIRVCIRERLHLYRVHCALSSAHQPILLHYCPCRHCAETMLHMTHSTVSSVYPHFSTLMTGLPERERSRFAKFLLIRPRNNSSLPYCIDALSAPWLLQRTDLPQLPYEGLQNDLPRLLATQADPATRIVIVSIFNAFWVDHLHNWVYSIVRHARMTNFVIATLDDEALALCTANRLPCYNASGHAEFEADMVAGGAGFRQGHLRKVTEAMSWIKPRLALEVLRRGYGFFMVDLDISWNRYPMEDISSALVNADLAHQCDGDDAFSVNSGFFLARPSWRTIQLFSDMQTLIPQESSDQEAMKLFLRYDHLHGVQHSCLDRKLFVMKCDYKVLKSRSVAGGAETFKWRPFDRDRSKFFWHMLHATCLSGAIPKLLYFRTMNAWFLDDLDALTAAGGDGGERKKEYCVVMPDGSHKAQRGITTVHSAKYPTGTDPTFLKERH